jgi:hypothetical protein
LVSTQHPASKKACFLDLLSRFVAGEIREGEQALIYRQPAGPNQYAKLHF